MSNRPNFAKAHASYIRRRPLALRNLEVARAARRNARQAARG